MSKLEQAESALQAKLQEYSSDSDSDVDAGAGDGGALSMTLTKPFYKKGQSQQQSRPSSTKKEASGVIYLGHLPREFAEHELKQFLSQFGRIAKLRVARSIKTGGHKGYAFIKFSRPDVAEIVADTLSGRLLMGKRKLVCHVVPLEHVRSSRLLVQPPQLQQRRQRRRQQQQQDPLKLPVSGTLAQMQLVTERLLMREERKRQKFARLGIEYEFPGYSASASATAAAATVAATSTSTSALATENNINSTTTSSSLIQNSEGIVISSKPRQCKVSIASGKEMLVPPTSNEPEEKGSKSNKKRKESVVRIETPDVPPTMATDSVAASNKVGNKEDSDKRDSGLAAPASLFSSRKKSKKEQVIKSNTKKGNVHRDDVASKAKANLNTSSEVLSKQPMESTERKECDQKDSSAAATLNRDTAHPELKARVLSSKKEGERLHVKGGFDNRRPKTDKRKKKNDKSRRLNA